MAARLRFLPLSESDYDEVVVLIRCLFSVQWIESLFLARWNWQTHDSVRQYGATEMMKGVTAMVSTETARNN